MNITHSVFAQTMLYGVSIAIMKGVSLLMLPFITHYLNSQDFGRLEIISSLAVIGSILVGLGLEDTLYRYCGMAKSEQKKRNIAAQIFALTLMMAFIILVMSWLFSPIIAQLIPGHISSYQVQLVLMMLALEGVVAVPLGWFRLQNKAFTFFVLTTSRALLQALLVVAMLLKGRGIDGVLEAGLIAIIVQALVIIYLQAQQTGVLFKISGMGRYFSYSWPIVVSGLFAFTLNGMDRWVLASYTSLNDVAHFGVAAKFALATVLLVQPFGMWWSPKRFNVLQQVNGHQKAMVMITLGIYITLVAASLVALLSPILIAYLLPPNYLPAAQYALIFVLVMTLREITELLNIGCFVSESTQSQLWVNISSAALGVTLMMWLTPVYAVWGLLSALLIAQVFRLIIIFKLSQAYLFLDYPIKTLMSFIFMLTLVLMISSQINNALLSSVLLLIFLTITLFNGLIWHSKSSLKLSLVV